MLRQPWAVAAAVFVLGVYAAVLWVMPKGAFWSPDEGAKFIQMNSVAWRDGFQYALPYGARPLDPELAFYPSHCRFEDLYPAPLADGTVKFHWPIWFPLASRFLVATLGLTGLYVVPLLSGWMVALLAGALMSVWDVRLAPLAILAVGLATPIAFFSLTFWEHTLATALGVAALAIVVARDRVRPRLLWLVFPLLVAAAALRVEMALFGLAVGCAWLTTSRSRPGADRSLRGRLTWRRLAVLGIGAALMAVFAADLPERHRWMLSILPSHLSASIAKLPYTAETLTEVLVDNRGNQAPIIPQVWRYLVLAACAAVAGAALVRNWRVEAIFLLAGLAIALEFSAYLVVQPQAYVSLHGFLPIAPFIIFAAYAVRPVCQEGGREQRALLIATIAYALFGYAAIVVFFVDADGLAATGLEWGNRYLLSLYPLGTVLALAGLAAYSRSTRPPLLKTAVTLFAATLLICGVLLQVRGVWTLVETRRLVTTWQSALRDGPPVMTDVWWLPAAMAPLFVSHPVQCVRQDAELETWYPVAWQHGAATFTFASFHSIDVGRLPHDGFEVHADPPQVISGLQLTRVHIAPAAAASVPVPGDSGG